MGWTYSLLHGMALLRQPPKHLRSEAAEAPPCPTASCPASLHSILITTTYVTRFTAHLYLWSQLTPFLLPGLFPPQGCLSLSVRCLPPLLLPCRWLCWPGSQCCSLRSLTLHPCCPDHSPGSRHLGSVMLLMLSYAKSPPL